MGWLRFVFIALLVVSGILTVLAVTTGKPGYWLRLKQVLKLGLLLVLVLLLLFFVSRLLRL